MDLASTSSSPSLNLETGISTISSPTSSTTSLDSIMAATYHAVDGTRDLHYSYTSRCNHLSNEAIEDDLTQTAFGQAYQYHAQTSHMGILDPAYKIFRSKSGYGYLVYKIQVRTMIITGDPLCSKPCLKPLLDEVDHFRASRGLALVFVGMSKDFIECMEHNWVIMQFGHERVLNPLSNKILQNKGNKRMITQNKQLLDPKRGGTRVHLYSSSMTGIDLMLENRLRKLYDDWRQERNQSHKRTSQAFVTVYDLFSHRDLTMFLYTSDRNGNINGFATLRALGARAGFHVDPCIASPDAPRGITDLLIVSAMQLLSTAGIGYLSFGFEPLDSVRVIGNAQGKLHSRIWKHSYDHVMKSSSLKGKAAYFKKFYPDESLTSELFICFPNKHLPIRESLALLKFANINIRQLFISRNST